VSDAPAEDPPAAARPWKPLLAAAVTTAAVTAASYGARGPVEKYGATLVGVGFLASTWWLVLRHDEAEIRAHGLSLGGLMEPARIDPRRLLRDARAACNWALLAMAVTFPPFALGYRFFYACSLLHRTLHCLPVHFALRAPPSSLDELGGQLVVIALPEEAFFRVTSSPARSRRGWRCSSRRCSSGGCASGPGGSGRGSCSTPRATCSRARWAEGSISSDGPC
jgi:uncharacterized protein